MRNVATQFASNMDNILGLLDVTSAAVSLAKESVSPRPVTKPFLIAARRVHQNVHSSSHFTLVAFDGAFLTACAEYELAVRHLLEAYISRAVTSCPKFNHLPKAIRDWYPEGCARIIINLKNEKSDKFRHLTQDSVVRSLADCIKNRSDKMLGEAFSDSERNFWPDEVEKCLQRVGIEKIWQKASRDSSFQMAIGTTNPEIAEQVGRLKLTDALTKRNNIIHRGRLYYAPSDSEVRECVEYFRILVVTLAEVMEKSLVAL